MREVVIKWKQSHECDDYAYWLASISRASFSTNEKQNHNQSQLVRAIFPALLKKFQVIDSYSDWFALLIFGVNYHGNSAKVFFVMVSRVRITITKKTFAEFPW